jgi:MoxR-like ATPase
LPEAQLDRFLLKLVFGYPDLEELVAIVADAPQLSTELLEPVADGFQLEAMSALARQVPAASEVVGYAGRLLLSLQPSADADETVREYVRLGPSPRGGQALTLAGRIAALLDGRHNLAIEDIHAVALPALSHRLVLNFDAERDGIDAESIVTAALQRLDARG